MSNRIVPWEPILTPEDMYLTAIGKEPEFRYTSREKQIRENLRRCAKRILSFTADMNDADRAMLFDLFDIDPLGYPTKAFEWGKFRKVAMKIMKGESVKPRGKRGQKKNNQADDDQRIGFSFC